MNLSKRERILALGVGLVILIFALNYGWSTMRTSFETRNDSIASLKAKRDTQNNQKILGIVSKRDLNRIAAHSLPSNEEAATADYLRWLIQVAEEAGLANPQPRNISISNETDPFQSYKFQLKGSGTIKTATKLLYLFQSKDYLHRVINYSLDPINNVNLPNQLNISLECEVIALKNAKPNQPEPKNTSYRLAKTLDEYTTSIASRNLFARTNTPPQVERRRSFDAVKGVKVDYTVEATDPDPGQVLTYDFDGEVPKGMKIEPETGRLTWLSNELGSTVVNIKVADSGIPSKTSMMALTIKVAEPPPPVASAPNFDVASQAFVSALVADTKGPEAWVRSKTEGKTFYLRKGDELKLGNITGKVIEVGANFLELETNGKRWLVGLDESLAEAYTRSITD